MLTVAVTFLAALYLLGPDLLSRWIIGFVAPRRTATANRGEEITRAVLWAAVPLAAAGVWVWRSGVLVQWGRWSAIDNVYVCLSSTCSGEDRKHLWPSLRGVVGMNVSLLWREYLLVVLGALLFNRLIVHFGKLRRLLRKSSHREALAQLITPQIADWHVWLSDMLLPEADLQLVADVLTRGGTLYQGVAGKKTLASDGSLQTLTLTTPRRFLREEYKAAKALNPLADRETFWREIPGNAFVLVGADIVNVNILYVRRTTHPPAGEASPQEKVQIRKITSRILIDGRDTTVGS